VLLRGALDDCRLVTLVHGSARGQKSL